jgi:UDP-N-acetylmuramoyl-tripeptide--D-alanyl-D-alanine ligase
MPVRLVAVTGSVGKTSTKGMLGRILRVAGRALVAERSYNNEIGVPLTLLGLDQRHRYCAVEFAMRGPNEIAYLTELARPEVGVITNIGTSHIGRLGSREAIARAKGELLPPLPSTGVAVLNRDDFFFGILSELSTAPVLSFGGHREADVRPEDIHDGGLDGSSFTCVLPAGRAHVSLTVPGLHCVQNALAASAAAHALGLGPDVIAEGLAGYEGEEMRTRIFHSPTGSVVIDDSYNAAPASVEASLRLLAGTQGRRIFVFGGMAELGEEGEDAHRAVGSQVAEAGVHHLILVGELPTLTGEVARAAAVCTSLVSGPEEAVDLLKPKLGRGDTVLIKGSRVARLERVAEGLIGDA